LVGVAVVSEFVAVYRIFVILFAIKDVALIKHDDSGGGIVG